MLSPRSLAACGLTAFLLISCGPEKPPEPEWKGWRAEMDKQAKLPQPVSPVELVKAAGLPRMFDLQCEYSVELLKGGSEKAHSLYTMSPEYGAWCSSTCETRYTMEGRGDLIVMYESGDMLTTFDPKTMTVHNKIGKSSFDEKCTLKPFSAIKPRPSPF